MRLAALYHWARGTEILARCLLQGEQATPFNSLDRHFEAGVKAATAAGDARHEVILRRLCAAVRVMVADSSRRAMSAVNLNKGAAPPAP